jgi:hypothetical protein
MAYLNLGKIEDDPLKAIQGRAGVLNFTQLNNLFAGVNITAITMIPLRSVYQRDY